MTNKIRNVTKQLLGAEDVLFGRGTVNQRRGTADVSVHRLDLALPVADEAELAVTDPEQYPKASIGSRNFVAVNGQYQEVSTIQPVLFSVGAMMSAEYPYAIDGDTVAKWTGAFPKTLTLADQGFTNPGWLVTSTGLGRAIISETVPSASFTREGVRWYKPSESTTYVYYCDGDSCQWVQEPVQSAEGTLRQELEAVDSTVPVGGVAAGDLGRKYQSLPFLEDFGVIGDGIADDTTAINAAFAAMAGKAITGRDGAIYKITGPVNLRGSFIAPGSTIKPVGTAMGGDFNAAVYQTVAGKVDFKLDGSECDSLQYAIISDIGLAPQKRILDIDVSIDSIKNNNNTQQCIGVCVFRSSSATLNPNPLIKIRAVVDGVTATSNGVIGDNGGSARGILVSMNGSGTDAHCVIENSDIRNISSGGAFPNEDADGIQTFQADYLSGSAKGLYVVRDCKVTNSRKRGIKVQTVNTVVTNCAVDGNNCDAAYETYSIGTTFENLKAKGCTGTGITTTNAGTRITNCEVSVVGLFAGIRLYAGSVDTVINGGTKVTSTSNYPTDTDYGLIEIDEAIRPTIDNVIVNSTSFKGAAVLLKNGTITGAKISNLRALNTVHGIAAVNTTGDVSISGDTDLIVSGSGLFKIGTTPFEFKQRGGAIDAGIPIFTEATGNSSMVDADGVTITCRGNNAVLVPNGSSITNVKVKKPGTKATGYGILAGNSKVAGNTIDNFDVGIGYSFTTTAEVFNNTTVNCTTPFEKTGYTPFVEHNNYSR